MKDFENKNNYIQNTYDAVGNVTTFRDRRGNEWDYEYDSIYRLKKITDPLSNFREYVYNGNSMVTQVKKPPTANPPTVNFGYDNSSRVNSFTDELGNSASITYTNGLVTSVTDRKSQQFGFTYDDVGLLTEISMPNSQEITFEYDSLNRLTHFTDLVGTSDFTYDDIGRLTSTDDPYDFTHELTYNAESMITALSAEGDGRSYTWDTSGRMTEATRNSQTTDYTYNDASWVTRIDYPNSTNTNYTYNTRGWMTAIELKDSSNNTIFNLPYSYDANGNVTSETVGSDSISYTYDALNRLTFIDRPGTTNDTTYTYDSRGNRTQMQTGSVTNYLTFNAADELTRVDKPNNAYDTYTYDNNGNCTSMNVFYPQPLLASKNTENDKTLMRVHYPADYAPKPVSRWRYLSPYLPNVGDITPLYDTISKVNPEKAKWDREERWRELCMPMRDPDETTGLTYSSDNNLTHADLPNGNDLDFKYDAAGRRVEKKLTSTTTNNNVTTTTVTTYKYHYIGSQITTIEIDQTQTTGESTTTTKDDEMRIHLGANSRPISFEYYTENQGTQQTTSSTYYYHYDLHGNVVRVTNSSGTTVIQYTYDQLGTIVSETNSSNIYNPFAYMGEAQVIHDVEFDTSTSSPKTGLYNSGSGYYNPETGTFLGGSGTPASVNPTSTSAEEPTAQSTRPAGQLGTHAAISAANGGVPSSAGVASSADVEPASPYEGINLCGELPIPSEPEDLSSSLATSDDSMYNWRKAYKMDPNFPDFFIYFPSSQAVGMMDQYRSKNKIGSHDRDYGYQQAFRICLEKISKGEDIIAIPGTIAGIAKSAWDNWNEIPKDVRDKIVQEELKRNPKVLIHYINMIVNQLVIEASLFLSKWVLENVIANIECAAWGNLRTGFVDESGTEVKPGNYLMLYQLKNQKVRLYFGPGAAGGAGHQVRGKEWGSKDQLTGTTGTADLFLLTWQNTTKDKYMNMVIYAINFTGKQITYDIYGSTNIIEYTTLDEKGNTILAQKTMVDKFSLTIPSFPCGIIMLFRSEDSYRATQLGTSYRYKSGKAWSDWTIQFGTICEIRQ